MNYIFEIIDKSRRKIRLTKKQWSQILRKHPYMANLIEEIKETLIKPLIIKDYSLEEDIRYYYSYLKNRKLPYKYLLVIVKYLNGEGFIVSSYLEKGIN